MRHILCCPDLMKENVEGATREVISSIEADANERVRERMMRDVRRELREEEARTAIDDEEEIRRVRLARKFDDLASCGPLVVSELQVAALHELDRLS